jgi:hypothetical protein
MAGWPFKFSLGILNTVLDVDEVAFWHMCSDIGVIMG